MDRILIFILPILFIPVNFFLNQMNQQTVAQFRLEPG